MRCLISSPFPCASTSTVQVDWMHCVELRVRQDLCGNILWECVSKAGPIPGGSQNARVASLNTMLKAYNAEVRPVNPIGKLTLKMIRSGAKPPKLKSKAAECRRLQPWMKVLAKLLLENNPDEYHIRMLVFLQKLQREGEESSILPRSPRIFWIELQPCIGFPEHAMSVSLWRTVRAQGGDVPVLNNKWLHRHYEKMRGLQAPASAEDPLALSVWHDLHLHALLCLVPHMGANYITSMWMLTAG